MLFVFNVCKGTIFSRKSQYFLPTHYFTDCYKSTTNTYSGFEKCRKCHFAPLYPYFFGWLGRQLKSERLQFDHRKVGGGNGVWENGLRFLNKRRYVLETCGEMREKELRHLGLFCQSCSLYSGAVTFAESQLLVFGIESGVETQQIHTFYNRYEVFVVRGVAAVGVFARGLGLLGKIGVGDYGALGQYKVVALLYPCYVVGGEVVFLANVAFERKRCFLLLLDEKTVCLDGMVDGKRAYAALGVGEYRLGDIGCDGVYVELEIEFGVAHTENGFENIVETFGRVNIQRLCASAQVHGGDKSGQTEKMVAVEMRDKYGVDGLHFHMRPAYLVLHAFASVDKYLEALDINHLRRTAPVPGGHRSPAS